MSTLSIYELIKFGSFCNCLFISSNNVWREYPFPFEILLGLNEISNEKSTCEYTLEYSPYPILLVYFLIVKK